MLTFNEFNCVAGVQVGLDWLALESDVFSLGMPQVMRPFAATHPEQACLATMSEADISSLLSSGVKRHRVIPTDRMTVLGMLSSKLLSLCASIGSVAPQVRFSVDGSPIPGMLAGRLADDIARLLASHSAADARAASDASVTLILIDRSFDVSTVLLHDLNYQVCCDVVLSSNYARSYIPLMRRLSSMMNFKLMRM